MGDAQFLILDPVLPGGSNASKLFFSFMRELAKLPDCETERERNAVIEGLRKRTVKNKNECDATGRQSFVAAVHVIADLAKQGWTVTLRRKRVQLLRQENSAVQGDEARERIRGQLRAERDEQLLQPAVSAFIKSMEAKQLHKGHFVSIFSLMRDGSDLSAVLRRLGRVKKEKRFDAAAGLIKPYLQFIRNDEDRCPWTGLRLMDIWRYFRHTWATPYKSVPGRTMLLIVRDAAAPFHPVIGIAALSSAAVAVTVRDEKIGWTAESVIEELRDRPTAKLAAWLKELIDQSIDEIYKIDFLENDILGTRNVQKPSSDVIRALEAEGRQQRAEHHRFMESGEYKKSEPANELSEEHWEVQARSPLFRSKRALELAGLLSIRKALRSYLGQKPSKNVLAQLVGDRAGREAVSKLVRKAKADRVGTAIADLTVCGAIPPYNEILAGKLVAMLSVSPEVVAEYRRRYDGIPSLIASSMAGKPICRPADLVFVGTTSLYGQRPSQYDRISLPRDLETFEGDGGLRYQYLGKTRGIGTFHFGEQTVAELTVLLSQGKRGQQVNSVFGEGVNPRLRKLRDGLDALGLPTDELLNHGAPRLVYGVELISNTRAYLLGLDKTPRYILNRNAKPVSDRIVLWWLQRWMLDRLQRQGILDRVASHNFVHPIRHGARVELPTEHRFYL